VQTRSHLWTYFKEGVGASSKWWKANDLELTEVDERTVLEESIGLHMGGGPYMLFYARATPDPVPEGEALHELEWPTDILVRLIRLVLGLESQTLILCSGGRETTE